MPPLLMRIVEALKESYSALATVLKWPTVFGLMAGTVTYGLLATMYVGFLFGLIPAVAFFLLIQSVLIYYVIKRMREEGKESKIMKEGWEGRTDTDKVIEEYIKLIEEEKQ
jgi:predicted lipid-binding transport protein (Tim44 family)